MKLFLLKPKKDFPANRAMNPWIPSSDTAQAFVVRAKDEEFARALASVNHGDEGAGPWLDERFVDCVQIKEGGKTEVVCRDFLEG